MPNLLSGSTPPLPSRIFLSASRSWLRGLLPPVCPLPKILSTQTLHNIVPPMHGLLRVSKNIPLLPLLSMRIDELSLPYLFCLLMLFSYCFIIIHSEPEAFAIVRYCKVNIASPIYNKKYIDKAIVQLSVFQVFK